MDKVSKQNLRSVLTVVLAFMLAICMILAVACSGDPSDNDSSGSSSSSSSSASRVDYQTIANGDFEYRHDDATSYPVSSSIGWTRVNDSITTTALSSTFSSGIINTKESNGGDEDFDYKDFAKENEFPIVSGSGDDAVYFNPHTPEYYGLIPEDELYEYDDDQEITNKDKLPTSGDYVLMIYNSTSGGIGTAQKFTSSSTIAVESYGKITAWVLTKDLSSAVEGDDYGAYIAIINTLGGGMEPLIVKNIDTDGNWQKFEFYLESSDITDSTFRVALGLGFGSKEVQKEYVQGFAFFDNIYYEDITAEEYAQNAALANTAKFSAYVDDAKQIETYRYNVISGNFEDVHIDAADYAKGDDLKVSYNDLSATATVVVGAEQYDVYTFAFSHKLSSQEYSIAASEKTYETVEENFVNTTTEPYAMDATYGYAAFNAIASAAIDGVVNPVADNAETLYSIHNNGASSKITLKDDRFVVYDGTTLYITFFMKVKTGANQNGVTINLIDLGSNKTAAEKTTLLLSSADTNTFKDENTGDWAKVELFINNFKGDKFDRNFALEFNFGPTTVIQRQVFLTEGYALFTGFNATFISQDDFASLNKTGSYVGSAELGAEIINPEESDTTKDSYSFNYSASSASRIQSEVASSVSGYSGTVGGGKLVGGTITDNQDANVVAGIINTKYLSDYDQLDATAKGYAAMLTPDEDNDYVQPIIIYNKAEAAYGYVSNSKLLTTSSTTLVSVKLRVFGSATAYIYLSDSDPLSFFDVIGIEGKAVNRDSHKPVYSEDPEDAEVYEKFELAITAADCNNDWLTVNFVITTGEHPINYRVEVFNGSRDGANKSEGLVAIDSITTDTSVVLADYKAKLLYDYDTSDRDVHKSYAGVVKTVTYTDEDGFSAIKYTSDASSVEVYTYYDNAKTVLATYENIDVTLEVDETTPPDRTPDNSQQDVDEEYEANFSLPLQITSIIVSVVLILVLIVLLIRALIRRFKKTDNTEVFYNRSSRDKAQDLINYNKAKREAAAKEREEKPYDYDNPENNVDDGSEEAEGATDDEADVEEGETPDTDDGAVDEEKPE